MIHQCITRRGPGKFRRGLLLLLLGSPCWGQHYFVTALGGISTLSADAAAQLEPQNAVSLYDPKNGPALNVAGGFHLNNWFSVQANYIWNRNRLTMTEVLGAASWQQERDASQHAAIADLLLYFRPRQSRIRPYLSAGSGVVSIQTRATGPASGALTPAHPEVDAVKLPLRVAVGIDLLWRAGWGFRYSFSETITGNPISKSLSPAGSRALKNFQNLFGFVKYF